MIDKIKNLMEELKNKVLETYQQKGEKMDNRS